MAVFTMVKITPISFGESFCVESQKYVLIPLSEHWLAHLYHICCAERSLHSNGVLLLPRDEGNRT